MLVPAGDVGRQVDRRCLARLGQPPDDFGADQLRDQSAGDRRDRADGAAAGQRQHGVAVRSAVVESDVGVVDELRARRVPGVDPRGLGERRDGDQPVPVLLHQLGELDDRAVHAGVRRDHEDVGLGHVGEVVQPVGDRRVALEVLAAEHVGRLAADDDDVPQRDPVGRHQPAGATGDLHRQRLGVPGAERLDDAAGAQRRHDEVGRLLHGTVGLLGDLGHDRRERGEVGLRADPSVRRSRLAVSGRTERVNHRSRGLP